ncbi:MAG: hypothetical protein JW839_20820, partial [Candidatus Lokiarchaeota archaeon]|nr:hypothetical protein [Candidatus Lokiarchaeota archaeon]
ALDLLFFLIDDYLDEGRPLLHLDAYGQGYPTWWLDFERLWGNAELWCLGIGTWMGFFAAFAFGAAPGTLGARKAALVRWPLAMLAALFAVAAAAGLAGWFSPAPYSIGAILSAGWYPEYLPANVLFLLVAFSGIWLLPPAASKLRRGRAVMPLSPRMAAALLLPAAAVLHLAIVSAWGVPLVGDLQKAITSLVGLLFVTTPLFAFMVASIERKADRVAVPAGAEDAGLDSRRKVHAWGILSAMLAVLGAVLVALAASSGLDAGIDIKADFVPRNFLTWVGTALVATVTFFTVQGGGQG